jgi:hypothetical protein
VLARATAVERQDGEVRLKLGGLSVEFGKLRGTAESVLRRSPRRR